MTCDLALPFRTENGTEQGAARAAPSDRGARRCRRYPEHHGVDAAGDGRHSGRARCVRPAARDAGTGRTTAGRGDRPSVLVRGHSTCDVRPRACGSSLSSGGRSSPRGSDIALPHARPGARGISLGFRRAALPRVYICAESCSSFSSPLILEIRSLATPQNARCAAHHASRWCASYSHPTPPDLFLELDSSTLPYLSCYIPASHVRFALRSAREIQSNWTAQRS